MKPLAAAAIAGLLLGAQQEGRFKSTVDTVSVYATVNEADGRLATNLSKEDFTILDNGTPREISLFSNDTQPITVVVMLDMSGSMFSRFIRVRTSTLSFVDALSPQDRAQIGTFGEEIAHQSRTSPGTRRSCGGSYAANCGRWVALRSGMRSTPRCRR